MNLKTTLPVVVRNCKWTLLISGFCFLIGILLICWAYFFPDGGWRSIVKYNYVGFLLAEKVTDVIWGDSCLPTSNAVRLFDFIWIAATGLQGGVVGVAVDLYSKYRRT